MESLMYNYFELKSVMYNVWVFWLKLLENVNWFI